MAASPGGAGTGAGAGGAGGLAVAGAAAVAAGREAFTDYTDIRISEHSAVKVFVRLRPAAGVSRAPARQFHVEDDDPGRIALKVRGGARDPFSRAAARAAGRGCGEAGGVAQTSAHGQHAFRFHRVFGVETRQQDVFQETTMPLVDHVLEGYNSCVFAYGQTGSGKTFTMFGGEGAAVGEARGIIPRAVEHIFSQLRRRSATKESAVVVSFLEIYLDQIRDLGRASLAREGERKGPSSAEPVSTTAWYERMMHGRGTFARAGSAESAGAAPTSYAEESLEIREDSAGHVYVRDLTMLPVANTDEALAAVRRGFALRATHETGMNTVSSRSHTVFTVHVLQRDRASGEAVQGMLHLVDLAGSERLRRSHSEGVRRAEAMAINSSLTALGKVVMALHRASMVSEGTGGAGGVEGADGDGAGGGGAAAPPHIPYRDSKLTRVLQNSLGGNSFLALVATVHPREEDAEETLSSLMFAHRCRFVQNRPRVNYSLERPEEKDRRIRQLEAECTLLRRMLALSRATARLRIARLMADLDVKGGLTPDGRWRMLDGTVVGVTADQAARSDWARRSAERDLAPGGALSEAATAQAAQRAASAALRAGGLDGASAAGGAAAADATGADVALLAEGAAGGPGGERSPARSQSPTGSHGEASVDGGQGSMPMEELLSLPADEGEARARGLGPGQRVGGPRGAETGLGVARGPVTGLAAPSLSLHASDVSWDDASSSAPRSGSAQAQAQAPRPPRPSSSASATSATSATSAYSRDALALSASAEELERLRERVKELRTALEAERERNKSEQGRLREQARGAEQEAARWREEAAEARRQARDQADAATATMSTQVAGILAHNQSILTQSTHLLLAVPQALRVSERASAEALKQLAETRRAEDVARRRDLSNLALGAKAELDAERQRAATALRDAERERQRIVDGFTRWSAAAKDRQAQLEGELRAVWAFAAELSALVRDIEKGAVPVVVATSGRRAFHIPEASIPADPFALHPTGCKHLRALLEREGADPAALLARTHGSLRRPANAAANGSASARPATSAAASASHRGAAAAVSALAESLGVRAADVPALPHARGAMPPAPTLATDRKDDADDDDDDADRDTDADEVRRSHDASHDYDERLRSLAADIEARARRGEVEMDKDPDAMDPEEVRAHLRALRTYLREGAHARAQDSVLTDLAEEDAAGWVRKVVVERDHARARLAEERERTRELRNIVAAARRTGERAAATRTSTAPAHRGGTARTLLDENTARLLAQARL